MNPSLSSMADRSQLQRQLQQNEVSLHPSPPLMTATARSMRSSTPRLESHQYHSLAFLLKRQEAEMDQYTCEQITNLTRELRQRKKKHLTAVLRLIQSKISSKLRQKAYQFTKAEKRAISLESQLRVAIQERDHWQKIAKDKKAFDQDSELSIGSTGDNFQMLA